MSILGRRRIKQILCETDRVAQVELVQAAAERPHEFHSEGLWRRIGQYPMWNQTTARSCGWPLGMHIRQ